MFATQTEYEQFKTWAIEGSTIAMRMAQQEVEIPEYWHTAKEMIGDEAINLSEKLNDGSADSTDGTD